MMDGMFGMGAAMVLWTLAGIAILVLAALGAVWLARSRQHDATSPRPPIDSPEEILRRRYARGEIDEDEYLRRQSGLQ